MSIAEPTLLLTTIPFSGFYESVWSHEIDREEESYAEHFAGDRQEEDGIAPELRLDESEVASILFDVTDYSEAYREAARDYAEAYADWLDEEAGFKTGLVYESMSSPRYYNFETDRIFCHIPLESVEKLFAVSAEKNHKRLADTVRARFTSCDGFHSFYDNELQPWLDKPLEEWDHNEISTLLIALFGKPDFETMYYRMGDEWSYRAWESGVDWSKFEEKIADLRADKEAEARANDPDYEPPYRCPLTLDLFASLGV